MFYIVSLNKPSSGDINSSNLPCFMQNWGEIESLKNEKSPGIVLEKFLNSVCPFRYEPWVST